MTVHVPVLYDSVLEFLLPPFLMANEPGWFVDFTTGGGGHAAGMLEAWSKMTGKGRREDPIVSPQHKMLLIDQDAHAVLGAKERFASEVATGKIEIHCCLISQVAPLLRDKLILGGLADLGYSSDQLEDPNRGLSFMNDGPLDMRLNQDQPHDCLYYLKTLSQRELADVIFNLGEERFSRRISWKIQEARDQGKLPTTTLGLASLISEAVPGAYRRGRIHPATRTFQALRILVNRELEELDSLLERGILSLGVGGRLGIISFHSLEDRRVKNRFRKLAQSQNPGFRILTKKPIEASKDEVRSNSRSRSAKFRVIERIAE